MELFRGTHFPLWWSIKQASRSQWTHLGSELKHLIHQQQLPGVSDTLYSPLPASVNSCDPWHRQPITGTASAHSNASVQSLQRQLHSEAATVLIHFNQIPWWTILRPFSAMTNLSTYGAITKYDDNPEHWFPLKHWGRVRWKHNKSQSGSKHHQRFTPPGTWMLQTAFLVPCPAPLPDK